MILEGNLPLWVLLVCLASWIDIIGTQLDQSFIKLAYCPIKPGNPSLALISFSLSPIALTLDTSYPPIQSL